MAECDASKREAAPGRHAVVVGMGFIGCEVAASLTQLGVRVTAVFPGRAPLETVLGDQVGALIGAFHRANGVELLPGERAAAFAGTERLEAIVTAASHRIACDFAVVGAGIEPIIPGVPVATQNGTARPDPSITIYIAPTRPASAPMANWLPVPRGDFSVILRVYGPTGNTAGPGYAPPAITPAP